MAQDCVQSLQGDNSNPNLAHNCRFMDKLGLCIAYEVGQVRTHLCLAAAPPPRGKSRRRLGSEPAFLSYISELVWTRTAGPSLR